MRRKKNGVATKAPLRIAYEGSMHPSSECTALASARAHRVCIFVCNLARFHPRQPLFLRAPFSSLSPSQLFLSLFLSFSLSSFLDPHTSALIAPLFPSYSLLRFLTLLSNVYTTHVPLFSSYLPCSAHRHSAFTSHTYPHPKDPSRLVPFRTFTFAAAKPFSTL